MPDKDKLRKDDDKTRNDQLMKAVRHAAGIGAGWLTLTMIARQAMDLASTSDKKKRAADLKASVNAKYPIFTPDYNTNDTPVEEEIRNIGMPEKIASLFRTPVVPKKTDPNEELAKDVGIGAAGVAAGTVGGKAADIGIDAYLRHKVEGYKGNQELVAARLAAAKDADHALSAARIPDSAWGPIMKDKKMREFMVSPEAKDPTTLDKVRKFFGGKPDTPGRKTLLEARKAATRQAKIMSPGKLRDLTMLNRADIDPAAFHTGKAALIAAPMIAAAMLIKNRRDKTAAQEKTVTSPSTARTLIDKFVNPIPTDPNQPVTLGAVSDSITSSRYHPLHIAMTLAAMLGGGAAGYKLSDMLSSQREESTLDKKISADRNRLDRLFLEEWARTRGVPEKTAASNEDTEGWFSRAASGAGKLYLVYAAGIAALAYSMSKKYMDTNDPNRAHLQAIQDFAKREARVKNAPVLLSDLAVLPPGGKSAVPGMTSPVNMPTFDYRDPLGAMKM